MAKRISEDTVQQILDMFDRGEHYAYIAQHLGMNKITVTKYLKENNRWKDMRGTTSTAGKDASDRASDAKANRIADAAHRRKTPVYRPWTSEDLCTHPVPFDTGLNKGMYCTALKTVVDGERSDLCARHHQEREAWRQKQAQQAAAVKEQEKAR